MEAGSAELARTRLRQVLERLRDAVHERRAPLRLEALEVRGEPISYEEARTRPFARFEVGAPWGPPWSTTWFHVTGEVPREGAGAPAGALFDLGFGSAQTGFTCEALAWREGRPWRGVDPNHRWLPLPPGPVDFHLEAAANVRTTVGGPGAARSMLELLEVAEPAFVLREACLAVRDEAVRRVYLDFKLLLDLALSLPPPEAAGPLAALSRCAAVLDLGDIPASVAAAGAELQPALARRGAPGRHRVVAVGHAHLDTAWLWPVREGVRKAARTFSTALALMEEHPEFRFAASQPAQYAWMRDRYPWIWEGIKRRVAEGRWEPVGAMWVEADCNLPSGESLVRQLLHGKRFYRDELGVESEEVWLPDVFGYPASLPQLISEAGCRRFLTQKLSWNQLNRIPHDTFWWEGLDGTRVLTHFPPTDTYNGTFEAGQLVQGTRRYRDPGRSDRSLYLYGHGDGGGGPEADHVELARRLHDLEGAPTVRLGRVDEFFREVEADGERLATWSGELYFELHRGTYTTQARTKALNRRAEQALGEAELWPALAGGAYPGAELDRLWKELLLNQFHDILPGSGVDWVARDAERALAEVIGGAQELAGQAAATLAGEPGERVALFNPLGCDRREVVDLPAGTVVAHVPACGFAVVAAGGGAGGGVEADQHRLENDLLRVEWDPRGRLTSIWDKEAGREVLGAGLLGNQLRLHPDRPANWDAWDLDPQHEEAWDELAEIVGIAVQRAAGLRGAVRMTRRFGGSRLTQRLELDAGARVLRFHTEVDWRERHRALKAVFPVAVRSPRATYEIQFGHVERPTHRNTSWDVARFEVCAHRWIDLGEAGYGVALLNDSKYGHSVRGSEMAITLLRGPTHPDPTADLGHHEFTYALLPHRGDFRAAGVIEAAAALNAPLRARPSALPAGTVRSFLALDTPQVQIAAVKRAEDSEAIIVRAYEAWGGACSATLTCAQPCRRAVLTDLLEQERDEVPVVDGRVALRFGAFQVLTLKLER